MFSAVYESFKKAGWDKKCFFYLCMEDESLWQPLFGKSYPGNNEFESAMQLSYRTKMGLN
jgi:spore photoproduct lyase